MRRLLSALVLALASFAVSPAQAGGLLQDLFAPAPRPAPIVHYYAPAQPQIRFMFDEGLRVSRRPQLHRKAVVKRPATKRLAIGRKGAATLSSAQISLPRVSQGRKPHRPHVAKPAVRHIASVAAPATKLVPAIAKIEAPAQIDKDPTLRVGDAYMTPEGLRIYRGPQAKRAERNAFVDFRRSSLGESVKSQLAALEGGTRSEGRRIAPLALKALQADTSERRSVDRHGRAIRVVGP